jgi:hypothetical protein
MAIYTLWGQTDDDIKLAVGKIDLDTGAIYLNHKAHNVGLYTTSDGQAYQSFTSDMGDIPTIENQHGLAEEASLAGYARRSNSKKDFKYSILKEVVDKTLMLAPQLFVSLRALEKIKYGERAVTTILWDPQPIKPKVPMAINYLSLLKNRKA